MSNASDSNPQPSHYHVGRLDSVSDRLSNIEGKMGSLATKEDLANAKFTLLVSWVTIGAAVGVAIVSAIAGIVIRFWPSAT